jgi:predicted nucleotidyltransferase
VRNISKELLDEIINRLANSLHPDKIILFGSHAYGEPTDASDIDLLVVVAESDEPRHHRAQKAYRCLRGLTAPTELIVLTQQEIRRATTVPASFINKVLQRGKVLYG